MQHARLFISIFAALGTVACFTSTTTGSHPGSNGNNGTGSTGSTGSGSFECPTVGSSHCTNDSPATETAVEQCDVCLTEYQELYDCLTANGYTYGCDADGTTTAATSDQTNACQSETTTLGECFNESGGGTPVPTAECNYSLTGAASESGSCTVTEPTYVLSEDYLVFALNLGSASCTFALSTSASVSTSYTAKNVVSASCSYEDEYSVTASEGAATTGSFTLTFSSIGTSTTDSEGDTTWPSASGNLSASLTGSAGTVFLTASF